MYLERIGIGIENFKAISTLELHLKPKVNLLIDNNVINNSLDTNTHNSYNKC